MSRMSLLTRTDQKFLSFVLSSLWKLMPGLAGLSWRSNAVVLTAFCSSPVRRARLPVNVSAIRNSMASDAEHFHDLIAQVIDYLYRNAPRLGPGERPRRVTVQSLPCVRVDLRLQSSLERAVRVA